MNRIEFLTKISLLTVTLLNSNKSDTMMIPKQVTIRPSKFSVEETINRIVCFLEKKEVRIYLRINQQKEVSRFGKTIAPLELIIFGNPAIGFGAMASVPVSALDLPLKIIAWEDEKTDVWIAYNEPAFFTERYGLKSDITSYFDLDLIVSNAMSL